MANKNRILLLKEYLEQNSDEGQYVTSGDILKYLEEQDCSATKQTLRADIQSLRECGYGIEQQEEEGKMNRYAWTTRKWSDEEIQILIDAVSSAQFLSWKKSNELHKKLSEMTGPSSRDELLPEILVSEHIKARNEQVLHTVRIIRAAILENKKISFRYYQYDTNKKRVAKHEGEAVKRYWVSPYATIWNNERYYLVGWSDTRKKVTTYRIDRMELPQILEKDRVPEPKGFNIRDYTDKIFSMFDGPEEEVTLRCRSGMMDQVIDKFGVKVEVKNIQDGTFDITVPVSISPTFYGWLFQFVGEINIVAPGNIKDAYVDYLQHAIDLVLSTNN